MSENKSKKEILDDFWDISQLVSPIKSIRHSSKAVTTVEINDGYSHTENKQNKLSYSSNLRYDNSKNKDVEQTVYIPVDSLIHKVTLTKEKSEYDFYSEFCHTAEKLWKVEGRECEYVDFFSYSPQYNQLTDPQLKYYLWWRENVRRGVYKKTNLCYIQLYTFELINAWHLSTPEYVRDSMVDILENYEHVIKGVVPRYIRWISDFSLIHRLQPPRRFSEQLLKKAGTLKEYFVRIEGNSPEGWARVLLTYCCSYDYRSSKFATEENIQLFNTHVFGALVAVVKKLSQSGRILGELPYDDCRVCGKAFEGAVCSSASRYTIDVEYCSFSRSHELRFLVGDVVKYAENKIRQHISVKSKLTVYSLPNDVREVIDEYFADALPYRRKTPIKPRVEEYDVLYDLPAKKLDISNAEKIEKESWMTTKELVEAFEDSPEEAICVCESQISQKDELRDNAYGEGSLIDALGEYAECAVSLLDGNCMGAISFADKKGEPIEMVVDRINEIAVEIIGDILIEDNGNGFSIVDDYTDFLKITEK